MPVEPVRILQGVQQVQSAALNVGQHHSSDVFSLQLYWPVITQAGGRSLGQENVDRKKHEGAVQRPRERLKM